MAKGKDVDIKINTNVWDEFSKMKVEQLDTKARAKAGITEIAEQASVKMREYAQKNRRWTDRTGYAKMLLQSVVATVGKKEIQSIVAHGVDYGVYLEYSFNRRYAILEEARDAIYPEAAKAIQEMLGTTSTWRGSILKKV